MKIVVAIDDIRQLDGAKGGETASFLTRTIEEKGWGKCSIPSRHRLYPHPDTGCKKHNTVRSFSADIDGQFFEAFLEFARSSTKTVASPESNTGLVVAVPEQMVNTDELVDYAYRVKEQLVGKADALAFAGKPGIHLCEISGNGQGVIGALAGAGLRITGNDGQFRGKLKVGSGEDYIATVGEIIAQTYVEQVKNMDLETLDEVESVRMGEKVKVVLLDDKYTLMVFPTDIEYPKWQTSTTHMLRMF